MKDCGSYASSTTTVNTDRLSYQAVNEEKLEDVQQHPAQWDLQGPQVGVGSEEGDESQRAEDVGDGKQRLCNQGRVPHLPLLPGPGWVVLWDADGERKSRSCRVTNSSERKHSDLDHHIGNVLLFLMLLLTLYFGKLKICVSCISRCLHYSFCYY